ncbi:MAG: exodeoxyribonuclease VII large subunit [Chlamydiales bacterium]|nr:exodeoxyribonuclease VII large subunit [Chlamydiia bacterium]MCP5508078.1 exodeoxyribonuclease VII large subunit [Chlamydiales bacterium]
MTSQAKKEAPILSVSQLTQAIKLSLESTFPLIWVQGEVSNFKKQSSGHMYFSIKDDQAQISAIMFRGDAMKLKAPPKDGDQVIVRGELNVYPPSGKYQVLVRELRLAGIGELLLRLEELKKEIYKRGWFKPEHKKAIPRFPKRIGVVTSPTGAAIQDILNVLTRRFSGFHLILNPVRVQGSEAAGEIAKAIKQFNDHDLVDVIIVGRGGGSIEDLWAFNEEIVAEAVFQSRIPIICAVGHETDHCIAEYVADVRAPTPSAAAEMVIAEKESQIDKLRQLDRRLQQTIRHQLRHCRQQLTSIAKQPMLASPYAVLGIWMQRLDDIKHRTDVSMQQFLQQKKLVLKGHQQHIQALNPITLIRQYGIKLEQYRRLILQSWKQKHAERQQKLLSLTKTLQAIDPKTLLSRGYSIAFSEKDGSVISSIHQLRLNDEIRIMLSDGEAKSTVNELRGK